MPFYAIAPQLYHSFFSDGFLQYIQCNEDHAKLYTLEAPSQLGHIIYVPSLDALVYLLHLGTVFKFMGTMENWVDLIHVYYY